MPQVMVLPPSLTSTTTKVSGASTTSSHATRSAPISKFDSAAQSSTPTHAPSPRLSSPPTRTSSTTQPTTLASASATTATPDTGPPIDSSWSCENDEQTCIKMFAPDTHANADAFCTAMQGRIVTVPNIDYQQWLDNLDFMNVGYFVEPANVDFSRWGPGHPLDDAGFECQIVDTDGFWRSVDCATHTHAYICQVIGAWS